MKTTTHIMPNIRIKEGDRVSICVKSLYENLPTLSFGHIVPDFDENGNEAYYDLYNEHDDLSCCDGETCLVVKIDKNLVTLISEGSDSVKFTLTKDEIKYAIFA